MVCLSFSKDGTSNLVAVDEGSDHTMTVWDYQGIYIFSYSSNLIRKTQNEHLIVICQNLISREFKANFLILSKVGN